MEHEIVLTLIDEQRKYFNDVLDHVQRVFTDTINDTEKKISDIITSLEFTQSKLDDAQPVLSTIQQLRKENETIRIQLKETKTRLDYLDDQSRRNNLRFSGVPELPNENWEQSQHKIQAILKNKMNVTYIAFDHFHRISKPNNYKPLDIFAKFARFSERDFIYQNRRKLKGSNVFANEDFCPDILEIRRSQQGALSQG